MDDSVTVTGPDGNDYEFPAGTTKEIAIKYFRFKAAPSQPKGYTPQPGDASLSAPETGATGWLKNLESDFRYGTDTTLPGRILKTLGAQGINRGAQQGGGETLESMPLGLMHAAQGVVSTPEHPVKGPLKAAGGLLEAATLPMSFMAPEANMGTDLIPSKSAAKQVFEQLKGAIGDRPVNIQNVMEAAKKAEEFSSRGGGPVPDVIKKFMQRIGKSVYPYASDKPPLTFEEARDFYSNASGKLTAEEAQKLRPYMLKHLGEFTRELGGNVQETANQAGYGDLFASAMKDYRRSSQLAQGAKSVAKGALKGTGLGIGASYGLYELANAIARGGR